MDKRCFRFLSLAFFLLGIFFLLNLKINITGAIIGVSNTSAIFNSVFGVTLIFVSLMTFVAGERPRPRGKLENVLINTGMAIVLGGYGILFSHAHFVPRKTTATIENVSTSKYNGNRINIIETNCGRFRNEDSFFYGKHNSERLQETAKSLIGKRVKIKNYGYSSSGFSFKEYPSKNVLDIEKN